MPEFALYKRGLGVGGGGGHGGGVVWRKGIENGTTSHCAMNHQLFQPGVLQTG